MRLAFASAGVSSDRQVVRAAYSGSILLETTGRGGNISKIVCRRLVKRSGHVYQGYANYRGICPPVHTNFSVLCLNDDLLADYRSGMMTEACQIRLDPMSFVNMEIIWPVQTARV